MLSYTVLPRKQIMKHKFQIVHLQQVQCGVKADSDLATHKQHQNQQEFQHYLGFQPEFKQLRSLI